MAFRELSTLQAGMSSEEAEEEPSFPNEELLNAGRAGAKIVWMVMTNICYQLVDRGRRNVEGC